MFCPKCKTGDCGVVRRMPADVETEDKGTIGDYWYLYQCPVCRNIEIINKRISDHLASGQSVEEFFEKIK